MGKVISLVGVLCMSGKWFTNVHNMHSSFLWQVGDVKGLACKVPYIRVT